MNKGHFTQWATQFAVASELCKRSYQLALTLGNHPAVDLMVVSPSGRSFSIDVKGVSSRSGWLVPDQARPYARRESSKLTGSTARMADCVETFFWRFA
jgi:hypothetical protein